MVWISTRQNRRLFLLSGIGIQFLAGCIAIGGHSSSALSVLDVGHLTVALSGLVSGLVPASTRGRGFELTSGLDRGARLGVALVVRHRRQRDLTASVVPRPGLRNTRFSRDQRRRVRPDAIPARLEGSGVPSIAPAARNDNPDHRLGGHDRPIRSPAGGALAWPAAVLVQYWLLWRCETDWSRATPWVHCGTLWHGVFLVWREAVWLRRADRL